jgi:uncharacterized membrane protein YsdA (DUF1294 family)
MNLIVYLLAVNAATIGLYWLDKRAARSQAARVPEYVLLLAGFLGGTLAALFAMRRFRHKTKKTSFRMKFWALTAAQIALIAFPPMALQAIFARLIA